MTSLPKLACCIKAGKLKDVGSTRPTYSNELCGNGFKHPRPPVSDLVYFENKSAGFMRPLQLPANPLQSLKEVA